MTDGPSTEDVLLRRWRAGDRDAGAELLQRCKPMLRWFFRRRTSENVEELVQGTLVACVQALPHFEGRSTFKTFLLGIAHKQFLMSLRASRRREMHSGIQYRAPSPSQVFASKEESKSVSDALNDTSPAFRRVLEMFYWEELSVEQIAKALDLPAGTVKSRLSRGRTMVRERIAAARKCSTEEEEAGGGPQNVAKAQ
jgi:RNA polymerase sigma-70 factor (ECF subfamily)